MNRINRRYPAYISNCPGLVLIVVTVIGLLFALMALKRASVVVNWELFWFMVFICSVTYMLGRLDASKH